MSDDIDVRSGAQRRFSRRHVLGAAVTAGGVLAFGAPLRGLVRATSDVAGAEPGFLDASQMRTLSAAMARIVPSNASPLGGATEWGAADYVQRLLTRGVGLLYAGGPVRCDFAGALTPWPVKREGWARRIAAWRRLYVDGLARLDAAHFTALDGTGQDAVLEDLDVGGSEFFTTLFLHTMEGCYAHPVYGGNRDYRGWRAWGFRGDTHGVTHDDPVSDFAPQSGARTQLGLDYNGTYGTNPFGLTTPSYGGTVYAPDGWERYARCGLPTGGFSVAAMEARPVSPEQPVTDAACAACNG